MIEDDHGYAILADGGLRPSPGHLMLLTITAENPERLDHPAATGAVRWSAADTASGAGQAGFKFHIDGDTRSYYIPLGLEKDWPDASPDYGLRLEIPQLDGIDIEVHSAVIKKRLFFPVDIFLARLMDSPVIPGYADINSMLMPSYILLFILIILAGSYYLLFRKDHSDTAVPGRHAVRTVLISILVILVFFSAAYIYDEVLAVKSHWKAYGDQFVSGRLEETYTGIYGFEKFIAWAHDTIPEDSGIIVSVRGEPVYIMSEMAFNMYPRDIRFLDISGKTSNEVKSEIEDIPGDGHDHLVILSQDDTHLASGYELIDRYRSTGGYIYRIR